MAKKYTPPIFTRGQIYNTGIFTEEQYANIVGSRQSIEQADLVNRTAKYISKTYNEERLITDVNLIRKSSDISDYARERYGTLTKEELIQLRSSRGEHLASIVNENINAIYGGSSIRNPKEFLGRIGSTLSTTENRYQDEAIKQAAINELLTGRVRGTSSYEAKNYFKSGDYAIDRAESMLNKENIKQMGILDLFTNSNSVNVVEKLNKAFEDLIKSAEKLTEANEENKDELLDDLSMKQAKYKLAQEEYSGLGRQWAKKISDFQFAGVATSQLLNTGISTERAVEQLKGGYGQYLNQAFSNLYSAGGNLDLMSLLRYQAAVGSETLSRAETARTLTSMSEIVKNTTQATTGTLSLSTPAKAVVDPKTAVTNIIEGVSGGYQTIRGVPQSIQELGMAKDVQERRYQERYLETLAKQMYLDYGMGVYETAIGTGGAATRFINENLNKNAVLELAGTGLTTAEKLMYSNIAFAKMGGQSGGFKDVLRANEAMYAGGWDIKQTLARQAATLTVGNDKDLLYRLYSQMAGQENTAELNMNKLIENVIHTAERGFSMGFDVSGGAANIMAGMYARPEDRTIFRLGAGAQTQKAIDTLMTNTNLSYGRIREAAMLRNQGLGSMQSLAVMGMDSATIDKIMRGDTKLAAQMGLEGFSKEQLRKIMETHIEGSLVTNASILAGMPNVLNKLRTGQALSGEEKAAITVMQQQNPEMMRSYLQSIGKENLAGTTLSGDILPGLKEAKDIRGIGERELIRSVTEDFQSIIRTLKQEITNQLKPDTFSMAIKNAMDNRSFQELTISEAGLVVINTKEVSFDKSKIQNYYIENNKNKYGIKTTYTSASNKM